MNKRVNKVNSKFLFIVGFIIALSCLVFLLARNNITTIFAYSSEAQEETEEIEMINEEPASTNDITYDNVFYFKNGSQDIGALQISIGDNYTFSQYGYTINGQYTAFANSLEMNKCAYGSYYGYPTINGVSVATYSGWMLNGDLVPNSGQWQGQYSGDIIFMAKWTPVQFTATLNYGYSNVVQTRYVNYFDGLILPEITRSGYELINWRSDDNQFFNGGSNIYLTRDTVFTAQWAEIFDVTLISTTHRNYTQVFSGASGATFTLPELTEGNYYVSKWGTYSVGSTYTINGDVTLYAVWSGNKYNITYSNLSFRGRTSYVLLDGSTNNSSVLKYEYGVGLDLSDVTAFWPSDGGEYPQLVFLGWYTDMNFTTQVTSISATSTGAKTLYAKWRYDMFWIIRNGQHTVNNSSPLEQSADEISVGLNVVCSNGNTLWQELKNIGINNITFNLKIRYWGEGTASVFIYNQGGSELASSSFEATSTTQVRTLQYTISLNDIGANPFIYIRYQASSYKTWIFVTNSHIWYNDKIYLEVAGTVESSDMSANGGFTWSYNDPF